MTTNIDKKLDRVLEIGAEIERLQQELRALFGDAPRTDYLGDFVASQAQSAASPPPAAAPVAPAAVLDPYVYRRRGDLLDWVMRYVLRSTHPVRAAEIAEAAGLDQTTTNSVNSALARLALKGLVFRLSTGTYWSSRAYEVRK